MKNLFVLALALTSLSNVHGQIFSRLVDKVAEKVEDHVVDLAAEAIAKQVYRSIDQAVDSMLYESYVLGGADTVDYAGFLANMDATSRLPLDYQFDVVLDVEVTEGKKRNKMRMLMRKDGQYFGFEQYEEDASPIMVIDGPNSLIAMYQEDDSDRSVIAMPNMITKYTTASADAVLSEKDFEFEKTGKTRTILGYVCDEYRYESDTDKGIGYAAVDFPVSWSEALGNMFGKITSVEFGISGEYMDSMLLRSSTESKESNQLTTWEVVNISLEGMTIDNSTYTKTQMTSD